ncbi:fasciclin-like arabinogalactan protein 11 [Cornus florida]|uniref:fasciclin-like arabinogalactan protein 11 n=1 Tax=Cornus florida TaxID=4283 RepID=UPI0028A13B49|nr:fasciclin-like arabinogalactan protein 11 [Cornus florida]
MLKPLLSPLSLLVLFFFLHCTTTFAQSPAQSPAPSAPTNITSIFEKAGQFTTLIRLLKSTQVGDQLNTQLKNSNQGLTIFAPTDNAFANLKSGTLNSLSDQQKVQLIQFHILPSFLSMSQFQTVSNPVRTQAGDSQSPLNVTTSGNQVNITTGVVNAAVANTIYTDTKLAVYQVDQVLLPLDLFGTPAPAPSKPRKKASDASSSSDDGDNSADSSPAICLNHGGLNVIFFTVSVTAALLLCL